MCEVQFRSGQQPSTLAISFWNFSSFFGTAALPINEQELDRKCQSFPSVDFVPSATYLGGACVCKLLILLIRIHFHQLQDDVLLRRSDRTYCVIYKSVVRRLSVQKTYVNSYSYSVEYTVHDLLCRVSNKCSKIIRSHTEITMSVIRSLILRVYILTFDTSFLGKRRHHHFIEFFTQHHSCMLFQHLSFEVFSEASLVLLVISLKYNARLSLYLTSLL